MKQNTNTSNNTKNSNGFEQFNANEEYIEYQKAMENLRKAQDKFLNKQRECMKRYNAEMAKTMQQHNTPFNQFHPGQCSMHMQGPRMSMPLAAMPFNSVMPPQMSMHPSMMYSQAFYHYDAEDEKLFRICNAIINNPVRNRDGAAGLAMLAAKVAGIADPTAETKFIGMGDNGAHFSITRRGPFGERVRCRTIYFLEK